MKAELDTEANARGSWPEIDEEGVSGGLELGVANLMPGSRVPVLPLDPLAVDAKLSDTDWYACGTSVLAIAN